MRVISFVNMKGGVGKTTLAVNVADALNRRYGKRVLIVDIDPQFNATQCLYSGDDYVALRQAGGHTIADLFNESVTHSVGACIDCKHANEGRKTPLREVSPE